MKPPTTLKILEIGTMDNKGGAAAVSWNLKQQLEARGHVVNMLVGYKRSHDSAVREIWDTPLNNLLTSLTKRNFRARLHHHLAYWLSNDIAFLPGRRIKDFPEFRNADLVHLHNLHTLFFNLNALPLLTRLKPTIWTLHDMWPFTGQYAHAFDCAHWMNGGCNCILPSSLPPFLKNNSYHLWNLKRRIYEQSNFTIVVPSQWLKDKVEKSMLKNKPLQLIYNGIDTEIFAPKNKHKTRLRLGLPENKKIILFYSKGGSGNVWKGGEFFTALTNKYSSRKDLLFICMGGYGHEHTHERVVYLPFTNNVNLVVDYYTAADFLLYPSIADNCPLTVLEAMSCGTPILAFYTGGIPELVLQRKNGYLAQYGDIDDLSAGFDWFTNLSEREYKIISDACRQRVINHFSLARMVNNYLALYYRVIDDRNAILH